MPLFKSSHKRHAEESKATTSKLNVQTNGEEDRPATADTPSPVPLANKASGDNWQSMQSLEEALENIASDHPPRVARSIPKGLTIDSSKLPDKSMRHCLYSQEVYDDMLAASLDVCSQLQNNLGALIEGIEQVHEVETSPTKTVSFEPAEDTTKHTSKECDKSTSWFGGGKKRQAVKNI